MPPQRPTPKRTKSKRPEPERAQRSRSEPGPSGARAPGPEPARLRPAFADAYPRDEALDELVAAFERGNFAHVRRRGPLLAEQADDPEVQAAARDLLRRIQPDPLALFLVLLGVGLVLFLYGYHALT